MCAQPNGWKLGDFLACPATVEVLTSATIRTVTYKVSISAANITKAEAVQNSLDWHLTEPDVAPEAAVDNIPASNDDFAAEAPSTASSSPGSSASHAATPAKRTRRG